MSSYKTNQLRRGISKRWRFSTFAISTIDRPSYHCYCSFKGVIGARNSFGGKARSLLRIPIPTSVSLIKRARTQIKNLEKGDASHRFWYTFMGSEGAFVLMRVYLQQF